MPLRAWRRCVLALVLTLAGVTLHASAYAARMALVVGNDNYLQVGKLQNAVRDAELMSQTLGAAGFQVTLLRNLDRQALYAAIDRLQNQVNSGDEVAFFFAGHGVQLGNDQVLLPVDIQADDERRVLREGVPLLYVQEALKSARLAMLVVDACRDNPFPKTGTRSLGDSRGLRPPEPAKGQVVILSAGRGEKALDSVPGEQTARNGLFTWEFAKVLRTPGLDVLAALRRVRDQVEDRAASVSHRQRPSLVDDLRGQFYLFGPPGATAPTAPAQAITATPEAVKPGQTSPQAQDRPPPEVDRRPLGVRGFSGCGSLAYPVAAQRVGVQGQTRIEFDVGDDGKVTAARLLVSSGSSREHGLLDKATVDSVLSCRATGNVKSMQRRQTFEVSWKLE